MSKLKLKKMDAPAAKNHKNIVKAMKKRASGKAPKFMGSGY